jgi:ubiquitin-like 1-activating enzyme E1 A
MSVKRPLCISAAFEWSPTCAVVGGILGQDILKALAAKEPPMANFFFFDGQTCNGTVIRMAMNPLYFGPPPSLTATAAADPDVLEID